MSANKLAWTLHLTGRLTTTTLQERGKSGLTQGSARFAGELGIEHTGIRDQREPFAYATVVFRDPDNIQLELIAIS